MPDAASKGAACQHILYALLHAASNLGMLSVLCNLDATSNNSSQQPWLEVFGAAFHWLQDTDSMGATAQGAVCCLVAQGFRCSSRLVSICTLRPPSSKQLGCRWCPTISKACNFILRLPHAVLEHWERMQEVKAAFILDISVKSVVGREKNSCHERTQGDGRETLLQ